MNSDKINFQTDILFSNEFDESINFAEADLIQLFPYGLSLSNDATRPFMILKNKEGDVVLPVPVNQLEAGVSLTQSTGVSAVSTAHKFSENLLASLDIKLERCLFVEIKGVHQYVRLYMQGHPKYQSLKFRADEVMSLCFQMKTPIFASRGFIQKSKVMSAEIVEMAQNVSQNPMMLVKSHQYLM
jgi:uncharacterized protein